MTVYSLLYHRGPLSLNESRFLFYSSCLASFLSLACSANARYHNLTNSSICIYLAILWRNSSISKADFLHRLFMKGLSRKAMIRCCRETTRPNPLILRVTLLNHEYSERLLLFFYLIWASATKVKC